MADDTTHEPDTTPQSETATTTATPAAHPTATAKAVNAFCRAFPHFPQKQVSAKIPVFLDCGQGFYPLRSDICLRSLRSRPVVAP